MSQKRFPKVIFEKTRMSGDRVQSITFSDDNYDFRFGFAILVGPLAPLINMWPFRSISAQSYHNTKGRFKTKRRGEMYNEFQV